MSVSYTHLDVYKRQDRETALEVLEEVLTTYHIHGQRGSDEYWWARDDEYRRFTFVITSI